MCKPFIIELLLPSNSPKKLEGKGPKVPVGKAWTPISGVNIVWEAEQRSNPALPEVSLERFETNRGCRVSGEQTRSPQGFVSPLGPGAGPSRSFPGWKAEGYPGHLFWSGTGWSSASPSRTLGITLGV